ncbi:MAG: hypothetical protein R3B06_17475 [Kofleriaceae bacterium]
MNRTTSVPAPSPSRHAAIALATFLLIALAACGKPAAVPRYDDGEAEFARLTNDLVVAARAGDRGRVKALAATLALPDAEAWFTSTFGAAAAPRLLEEYRAAGIDRFAADAAPALIKLVRDDGRTAWEVHRAATADDEQATGYQVRALRAMTTPTALYRLRLRRPDGSKAYSLWSFAYVAGGFRIVGKLKRADESPQSDDLKMLSELPVAEARALLDRP